MVKNNAQYTQHSVEPKKGEILNIMNTLNKKHEKPK